MGKSAQQVMRTLHRNIGFLVVGMTVIFALSGVTMVFRNAGFLQTEQTIVKQCPPNMEGDQLLGFLHEKDIKITGTQGNIVTLNSGSYDKATGKAEYHARKAVFPMNKFIALHKSIGKNAVGWIVGVYGLALLFLAVSSFWMFKPTTNQFKRGLMWSAGGIIVAIVLLALA